MSAGMQQQMHHRRTISIDRANAQLERECSVAASSHAARCGPYTYNQTPTYPTLTYQASDYWLAPNFTRA